MKPEARRAESGDGVLREGAARPLGSEPPPHQLGVWGSAVSSPSAVRVGTPENLKNGAT